jgi:hypothetical protein
VVDTVEVEVLAVAEAVEVSAEADLLSVVDAVMTEEIAKCSVPSVATAEKNAKYLSDQQAANQSIVVIVLKKLTVEEAIQEDREGLISVLPLLVLTKAKPNLMQSMSNLTKF